MAGPFEGSSQARRVCCAGWHLHQSQGGGGLPGSETGSAWVRIAVCVLLLTQKPHWVPYGTVDSAAPSGAAFFRPGRPQTLIQEHQAARGLPPSPARSRRRFPPSRSPLPGRRIHAGGSGGYGLCGAPFGPCGRRWIAKRIHAPTHTRSTWVHSRSLVTVTGSQPACGATATSECMREHGPAGLHHPWRHPNHRRRSLSALLSDYGFESHAQSSPRFFRR